MELKAKSLEDIREEFEDKYIGKYCVSSSQNHPQTLLKYKAIIKLQDFNPIECEEKDRWLVLLEEVHSGNIVNFDLQTLKNNFTELPYSVVDGEELEPLDVYIAHITKLKDACDVLIKGAEFEKEKNEKLAEIKKCARRKN